MVSNLHNNVDQDKCNLSNSLHKKKKKINTKFSAVGSLLLP